MSARPLLLDFNPTPRSGGAVGLVLLLIGVAVLITAAVAFHQLSQRRAGLELRLEALEARRSRASAGAPVNADAAAPVMSLLGTSWSLLLQELEIASHDTADKVAILTVEPDRTKGRIRIVGEARDLQAALIYVQRLQKSRVLKFPMLDSHEIRLEDHDQPVRFQLSADWKIAI